MALRLQDLPAPAAHLVLKVERFLRQELKVSTQNKSLLLSLSGGPDSTALALILTLLKKRLKLKEIAGFYLDHGLRKESKEEKRFLEDLSQRQGFSLYFFSTRVDLIAQKTGKGLEEIGRNLRYKLLTYLTKKYGFELVALGHHLNDLAEDVLMRFIRGTGWPALGGMEAKIEQDFFTLLRPLIFLTKEEILKFLELVRQGYCVDKSNEDLSFLRNRVRHNILPLFLKENPLFLKNVFKIWKISQLERRDLKQILNKIEIKKDDCCIEVKRKDLEGLASLDRLNLLAFYLDKIGKGQVLFDNLYRLELFLEQDSSSAKTFEFPGKKKVKVLKDKIVIIKENE